MNMIKDDNNNENKHNIISYLLLKRVDINRKKKNIYIYNNNKLKKYINIIW